MRANLLKRGIRGFWPGKLHHFHLVELVYPQEPPGILAVTSRFAPEAGGIGGVGDGQTFSIKHFAPVQVGDRYLSGRDRVEVIFTDVVNLVGKFRPLSCSPQRIPVD